MKYLEEPKLSWLTSFLSACELGDRVLQGRIEAYSCKMSTDDKKLAKEIYKSGSESSASPPPPQHALSISPFADFGETMSKKVLLNLISTMNASFPDYDFSHLREEHFQREKHLGMVMNSVNTNLAEFVEDNHGSTYGFLSELWSSIDQVVNLRECSVFSYVPELEADPFTDGSLWSFNYFFYHMKERKLVFFTCIARSKFAEMSTMEEEEEDGDRSDAEDESGEEDNDIDMDSDSVEWDED